MAPSIVGLLDDFSYSLTVPVHCSFFSPSNLFAIFDNRGRLGTSRPESASHTARNGRTRKPLTESTTTHAPKALTKEVIILEEPTAAHASSEWVHPLLLFLAIIRVFLLLHTSKVSKKVIIVIVTEKALERIPTTKSSFENIICFCKTESRPHIEFVEATVHTTCHASEISISSLAWRS